MCVDNMEGAKAVVRAAEQLRSPVILQVHPSSLSYGGPQLLALLNAFRRHSSEMVLIHLDHASPKHEEAVYQASAGGVDSIMVDGSEFKLPENIAWTAKMVRIAHECGVSVEGELGRLTGEEVGTGSLRLLLCALI
jgi:fructose/tagatose bisphosphate aldolase